MRKIILGDNAEVLPTLPEKFARLIYVDPPFNTQHRQSSGARRVIATTGDGSRVVSTATIATISKPSSCHEFKPPFDVSRRHSDDDRRHRAHRNRNRRGAGVRAVFADARK